MDSQLSWMPEDFLQEPVGFEGTELSKDLTADRRQGCVLFPNAFRARDPPDFSSAEMGPSMRKRFFASCDCTRYKVPQECRYSRKASVSVVFIENTNF